jgi:hypothetical protein
MLSYQLIANARHAAVTSEGLKELRARLKAERQ